MKRGEVWWVNFDPSVGGEIQKRQPAIIVSDDIANQFLNRLQVVPITSNVSRVYPSKAYVTLNGGARKAMADQLTTVSKRRIGEKGGQLSPSDLALVEAAIKVQLGLI